MARVNGSKNKTVKEKITEMIDEIRPLPVDVQEKAEVIEELEDLLGAKELSSEELAQVNLAKLTNDQQKMVIGWKADGTLIFRPGHN